MKILFWFKKNSTCVAARSEVEMYKIEKESFSSKFGSERVATEIRRAHLAEKTRQLKQNFQSWRSVVTLNSGILIGNKYPVNYDYSHL